MPEKAQSKNGEQSGQQILGLPFHPAVSSWFLQEFGKPSPPQKKGWPVIASGKHSLILAPTGSGKTLAAFLWCINELFKTGLSTDKKIFENKSGIHTLYISPLKALNNDIFTNLQVPLNGIFSTASELGLGPPTIKSAVRIGDTPPHVRQAMIKKPPHILITTPESLYLLLTSEKARGLFSQLSYIIVDEIHAVANNKRGVHLGLSLERLMPLCKSEPVRIGLSATQKPLERIAFFLGGQKWHQTTGRFIKRPVTIVDCGQRKKLDLGVISPTPDFTNLPDSSVWPQVINKLYDMILEHRTTLVFVNLRAQAEKIARQLNEKFRKTSNNANGVLALAHHGSISREIRYDIEARLKKGEIPAVIATASLELGIDIGSIDLVIQLESPKTVTSALQRVGRSGHLLKSTSKGRIIPLYQSDLDDAVAITKCMLAGEIEETHIPENCLDVLSQQIVAEVALQDWSRLELYRLFRQSYCYRHLTENTFDRVVDMLSGQYEDLELRALQPRITWDKINDQLVARRGSRLLAIMNGGTIADRGYYGVYLSGNNTRLGEMEEEFVFESRVGDVFYLGNNEWRIDTITRDRLMVSPLKSPKPRAPFWKGAPFFREFSTSEKVGDFREEAVNHIQTETFDDWLAECSNSDPHIAEGLFNYFSNQRQATNSVPTSKEITVEFFRDAVEEPQIVVHSPFGGKVNGAWCLALVAHLEARYNLSVQYSYNDDGLIIRLMDVVNPPPLESLFKITANDLEELFINSVGNTPLFTILFRHCATRALLLQRSRIGKRVPLWLQRLRAADLIQAVKENKDFPIITETYRECLQDVFDVTNFKIIINRIFSGKIKLHFIETQSPSPMTSALLFRFMAEHLYEEDRMRTTNLAAQVNSDLLAEILSRDSVPRIVTLSMAKEMELYWQFLIPGRFAKDKEDVFQIINQLGPISKTELDKRSATEMDLWIAELEKSNRIKKTSTGWILSEHQDLFLPPFKDDKIRERLNRILLVHGPVSLEQLLNLSNHSSESIIKTLDSLVAEKQVVQGKLIVDLDSQLWCDKQNFVLLYRKAISARRKSAEPANREQFYRFLLGWNNINSNNLSVQNLVNIYSGYYFPIHFFERAILSTRIKNNIPEMNHASKELDNFISKGELFPIAKKENNSARTKLCFTNRRQGHVVFKSSYFEEKATNLGSENNEVLQFLKNNGSSSFGDIVEGCGLAQAAVEASLTSLALLSLVSCENYKAFLTVIRPNQTRGEKDQKGGWHNDIKRSWSVGHGKRGPWAPSRSNIAERVFKHSGNWFLTSSFAVMGKQVDKISQADLQARLLLQRYGVLVKEFYRREEGLLPWYNIFQALKKMEWSGEIRRGYFIDGLSGIQFAQPQAVEFLEKLKSEMPKDQLAFISTIDPALPLGGNIKWQIKSANDEDLSITRSASNHLLFVDGNPVLYSENWGARVQTTIFFKIIHVDFLIEQLKSIMRLPANLRPRKKLELQLWDGQKMSACKYVENFIKAGFEENNGMLVLWPSAVES
jgi:ATP-dependent helicase Lhr and Lhr-like helicase